jgi:hypothetical protein
MGNDNECDYKLKSRDTLKVHRKSTLQKVLFYASSFQFENVTFILKKIDSITLLMHQLNNNSNSQTKRALTKPKGRYKNP